MKSRSTRYVAVVSFLVGLVGSAHAIPPPPPQPPKLRTAQMSVKVKLITAKAGTVSSITPVCEVAGAIPVYSGESASGHLGPIYGCELTWKGKKLDVSVGGALAVSAEAALVASASVSVTPPDAKPGCPDICGPQPLADSRAAVRLSSAAKSVTFELAPNPVSILRSEPTVWFEATVTITDAK